MPTFTFNNASGSDTAASGNGPATAVSGTAASYSGSVVTLDGSPDLSAVTTDHILWLGTSTGRQFFTLSAVDDGADTVTTVDAPAGTATGLNWGIGGKRKTLDNADSRQLFSDATSGWIVELEDDQTLTSSALTVSANGTSPSPIQIVSDTPGTTRTITQSANTSCLDLTGNYLALKWLKLQNSNVTKTSANGVRVSNAAGKAIVNCIIGDATNQLLNGIIRTSSSPKIQVYGCEIQHCTSRGIYLQGGAADVYMAYCYVHDNGSDGVAKPEGSYFMATNSIFTDNGGDGVDVRASAWGYVVNCTFDGNTSAGLTLDSAYATTHVIANNIFTNNGTYGLVMDATITNADAAIIDNNNFGTTGSGAGTNNSSGATSPAGLDGGSVTSVNVTFTDPTNDDWSVDSGQAGLGYPDMNIGAGGSASRSYIDLGAVQRQEPAGGSGGGLRLAGHGGLAG